MDAKGRGHLIFIFERKSLIMLVRPLTRNEYSESNEAVFDGWGNEGRGGRLKLDRVTNTAVISHMIRGVIGVNNVRHRGNSVKCPGK